MEKIYLSVINNEKSKVRNEKFDNVDYLVVPVVAAQEMVMKGLFYPDSSFRGYEQLWEGVPVPVNHPEGDVSVRNVKMQEATSVGYFFNVSYEDRKLKGEIWLNVEKAKRLEATSILEKFENEEVIEVSTGLLAEIEKTAGVFNDQEYWGIVRNIQPDHLALLPDEKGACSIADGCGTLRNNERREEDMLKNCECKKTSMDKIKDALVLVGKKIGIIANDGTLYENVRTKLETVLSGKGYIVDLNTEYVIYYSFEDSKIYKTGYTIQEDNVVLSDDTQEVIPETAYIPVNNSDSDIGEIMDKLNHEDQDTSKEDVIDTSLDISVRVDNVLNSIKDTDVKSLIENSLKEQETKKQEIISVIIANSAFEKEDLLGMSIGMLDKLKTSLKNNAPQAPVNADYTGNVGAIETITNVDSSYVIPMFVDEEVK